MPQNCMSLGRTYDAAMFRFMTDAQPVEEYTKNQDVSVLIERVNHLIDLLEQKSSVIITGQRAIEEYEKINKTS